MRKLYEIFKVLKVQKRIVSAETIRGNTLGAGTIRQKCESSKNKQTPYWALVPGREAVSKLITLIIIGVKDFLILNIQPMND